MPDDAKAGRTITRASGVLGVLGGLYYVSDARTRG